MLPDIITDLQFRTKTSLELSMHQYRPDVFPNNTGYTNTQDIIQFQNNLGKPHQKILEKKNIFPSYTSINNFGNLQVNQELKIDPSVVKMIGEASLKNIQEIDDIEETS
jgi:hypothetical protein